MVTTARLGVGGHRELARWPPCRPTGSATPRAGFIWSSRVAGLISGSDRSLGGVGEHWELLGHVDVPRHQTRRLDERGRPRRGEALDPDRPAPARRRQLDLR
jgi:hypothetical protein